MAVLYGGTPAATGGVGIWLGAMKANSVTSNGTVNAGPLGFASNAFNQKTNGIQRQNGDFSLSTTCFAIFNDQDWVDGNTWNLGGFF